MFFKTAGAMFELNFFPSLRSPEDFGRAASTFGWKNNEVAASMLLHTTSKTLPTTLSKSSAAILHKSATQKSSCSDIMLSWRNVMTHLMLQKPSSSLSLN